MPETNSASTDVAPNISVHSLYYNFPQTSRGLKNVSLDLPAGSRTLLIGANGAGKTTFLRLLSGKNLAPPGAIIIAGVDPFKDGLEGVTYLGTEWSLNPIVRTDIDVPSLLASLGGDHFPHRRDKLVATLEVDLSWRMHTVSDGERRRVQLAMGLIRPWSILLLDEVTVDLDLLTRRNFLEFLKTETETRSCTVVYATHILDNLGDWPTHLVHMHLGSVKEWGQCEEFQFGENARQAHLSALVLDWLEEDRLER